MTRAYTNIGGLRFDTISDLRLKYPKELGELTWANVYQRPDLQIKAGILINKDNYNKLRPYSFNDLEAFAFADAAYNGGISGLNKERRACYLTKGCDSSKWFGHTELFCLKSKTALYGNRSACDINRHHVRDVVQVRYHKYVKFFE